MNDFNQTELNILKEFNDIYLNVDKIEYPQNLLHVFNESLNDYMLFDPLFKYRTNNDNYLTYLVINDIKNQGLTYIIRKNDQINIDSFPYVEHCKTFNHYIINTDIKYIYYDDFIKNNDNDKYMLLYPYAYTTEEIHKIKNDVLISQEIPFTNNDKFNRYVFNKWNEYVSI